MSALESKARELFPYQATDHKAWSKRILWRLEQGDKTFMPIQVQFAKMAMNVKDEVVA